MTYVTSYLVGAGLLGGYGQDAWPIVTRGFGSWNTIYDVVPRGFASQAPTITRAHLALSYAARWVITVSDAARWSVTATDTGDPHG